MRDVQRIAIVDPSDSTREELRNVLLGMESVWLEAECSRYEFFFDVIRQSQPDVVVISLDSDQTKALSLIQTLSQESPELPVLAISARGDGQAILQALRCGAREFLTAPVVLEELLKALNRLQRTHNGVSAVTGAPLPARVESQVVAVVGSRGGVGCTSIAVNLGATLAHSPRNSVAQGEVEVALDLTADYTLADVAQNVDRLDMQFLKRSLSKHSSGLSLLPHPVQIEDAGLIREDHLQRVIGLLRASYTHLLLDLSKSFSQTDVTALHAADVILLVAQLELSSLRNVVRMMMTLGIDPQLGEKVRVVLNRVGNSSGITVKKAEETIGKPIYWQIPEDARAVQEARDEGQPLIQHAPRSKVQQSFAGLAQALGGKAQPVVKEKPRWALWG